MEMTGRKKKTKTCDKGSEEDWISKLPEHLISEILVHLPTKVVVKTSLLSTKWRNLWKCVPGLDLDSDAFSNIDAFVSFTDKFFDSHKGSWISRFRLRCCSNCIASLTQWINIVIMRTIKQLDVGGLSFIRHDHVVPLSIYTCQTLVHLRLSWAALVNVEIVSLPCLKILHLYFIGYANGDILEKLISGSLVLEDLTLINCVTTNDKVIQVRSQTLKRIHIDLCVEVLVDAPLLQCLRTEINSTKNFKIINLGFSTRLDIVAVFRLAVSSESLIQDILADVSRVRDLVIRNVSWQQIFQYSNSGPVLQFRHLSRLNATLLKSELEKLPTILESCPKLESLILELVKEQSTHQEENVKPKVVFSRVPECMVSSLKFVELKRSISAYEGETELIRYILKNSKILEKLRLDNPFYTRKAKCAFLTELMTMRRCSNACEVFVL